ncbi:MAG TPA: exodeoxyribonuclease III [Roseiflexaceae bacterium]|nr:exodeoxyribonuclease III [Roseiflexaceae bacterium]
MPTRTVKLYSWNVNGIRACAKKGFGEWLARIGADVVMLQETKANPEQLAPELCRPEGFHAEWSAAAKKGYSGVATFSRVPALTTHGLGEARFDSEGRVLISVLPDLTLFNIYVPSGSSGSERVAYKLDFYRRFLGVLQPYLERGDRVVVAGDINTAYAPIDLARPRENVRSSGFLPEERAALGAFFDAGLVDTFRYLRPEEAKYSWWSQVTNARERNVGWRLDYILVSRNLVPHLADADIHCDVMGSDHCPVSLTLALPH